MDCFCRRKKGHDKFKEIHKEHEILSDFIDPVTENIYINPVHPPCGHTFERESIERWIGTCQEKNNEISCPTCREEFKPETLCPDITLIAKVKKAYANLVMLESNNPNYNTEIKQAFIAMHKDLNLQAEEIMRKVSTDLCVQLNNKQIAPQAYARKMREITELFSDEA